MTDRSRESVVAAWPYGTIEPRFLRAYDDLRQWDFDHGRHIGARIMLGTTNVAHGRNQIVRQFLSIPWKPDWLWFVDTDMDFEPDTLDRLLASADPTARPIMGALCFALMKGDRQEVVPTLYTVTPDALPARVMELPEPGVHEVAATGTGCLLIHRRVFETLEHHKPPGSDKTYGQTSWPWFRWSEWETANGPDVMGEDLTFCFRAGEAGFPTHVDTRIEVGHVKPVVVDVATYHAQFGRAPQRAPRFVVIPAKDKVNLTSRLVGQLRGQYDGLFLLDNGSTQDKTRNWLASVDGKDGIEVVSCEGWTLSRMWNEGIRRSLAASVALTGDPTCDIAVLNNDLTVADDALAQMSAGLRSQGGLLAVSANYDRRAGSDVIPVRGICAGRYDGTGGFAGFAWMIRGEVFPGGFPFFDERLGWFFGDSDLVLEIEKAGGWYGIVPTAHVEHVDGGSQTTGAPCGTGEMADWYARDEAVFRGKWQAVAA